MAASKKLKFKGMVLGLEEEIDAKRHGFGSTYMSGKIFFSVKYAFLVFHAKKRSSFEKPGYGLSHIHALRINFFYNIRTNL